MARDLVNSVDVASTIDAAVLSSDTNGSGIDLQGFESATVSANLGTGGITFSGTNKIELKLEHSDDDNTFVAVTEDSEVLEGSVDADGVFFTANSAGSTPAVPTIGYRGGKRYVRVVADFSGTHGSGTPVGVTVIKGHPRSTLES